MNGGFRTHPCRVCGATDRPSRQPRVEVKDRMPSMYKANEYRKTEAWGYKKWHFCRNCTNWPKATYKVQKYEPQEYDLCGQCKRLAQDKRCSGPGWL